MAADPKAGDRSICTVGRLFQETGGAGPWRDRQKSRFGKDKQKRGLRRAFHLTLRAETHRLMRYCTAQFSRNEDCRQAPYGPDH